MNGANHLDEFDGQPLHLCPADLRKLASSVNHAVGGFAPVPRYRRLLDFYRQHQLEAEAKWVAGRLAELGSRCAGPPSAACLPCFEPASS